jgi:ribosomal protein S18 acetylase RimI-like enzyme
MSIIKKITSETTFSVRNPVLRPNLPVETCRFDGDNLPSTVHFGYYDNEKLVGIVSVFEKNNENWNNNRQFQIRGMAVLEEFQKKGIGEKLVQTVINLAQEKEIELIWFNARKNAVPFYEKIGFHINGTAFEIEGVGTHYIMYRFL